MPRAEERDVLIRRSREFLVEAEEAMRGGRFDLACFLAEQSLQLYLKARLLELTGEYPRTHYIRVLLARLLEALPEGRKEAVLRFIRSNRAGLSELEDAYIMARCSTKAFGEDDARDLVDLVRRTVDLLEWALGGEGA